MDGPQTDSERDRVQEVERLGVPYLLYRDHLGAMRALSLEDTWEKITVGRGAGTDLALAWDSEVSRVHAELLRIGDDWVLVDDGLSSNGTFVNGDKIEGRRRLFDGDSLRFGDTDVDFRAPLQAPDATMVLSNPPLPPPDSGS